MSSLQDVSQSPASTSYQGPELEPVFFGPARSLFGCLHAPQGTPRPGSGIVICPAAGPEYIRCHRSLRVLSALLARAGYPVLRFDYFATGDSLGEGEEATLERWQRDVNDAVRFMRGRYRATRLTLLGIRMGATLALRHVLERGGAEQLLLWDPVVKGRDFIDCLRTQSVKHEQWLVECHGARPASIQADEQLDMLGFRYSNALIDAINEIDLLSLPAGSAASTFILDNCEDADTAALAEHLQEIGLAVELKRFEAAKVWMHEPYQGLLSAESLKLVEGWISGGANE